MKRVLVFAFILGVGALGLWFALRGDGGDPGSSPSKVTALLPKETLGFFHLPDFEKTRASWRETDLYKLWREPAMQEFMKRPLARMPEGNTARERMQDLERLAARDLFVALLAFEEERATLAGGFRFKGSKTDAERVIGRWRERWQEEMPDAKPEIQGHQGHQLEILQSPRMMVATAYAGSWFFAANDLEALKALLDRADQRVTDEGSSLGAEENFAAALKQMPADYAALGYARMDEYMKKLADRVAARAGSDPQVELLREVRSVAATTTFEGGRVRDVFHVVMPKAETQGELTRKSLGLATRETFLYFATILTLPKEVGPGDAAAGAPPGSGVPGAVRRLFAAGAANQITRETWNEAFGQELGVIGDWPVVSRLPALFFTLEVKDAAKARHIVETITTVAPESGSWRATEKDGVRYYSQPPPNPLVPMALTIGLSERRLVAGLDAASVERAMQQAETASELATKDVFKAATDSVPEATHSFTFLDTPLLYERLDAALRPMLVMAAAFVPNLSEKVDWVKLPPAEVITRHLSPLVVSQAYAGNGYRLEAVGPTSLSQVALGAFLASGQTVLHSPPPGTGSPTPSP